MMRARRDYVERRLPISLRQRNTTSLAPQPPAWLKSLNWLVFLASRGGVRTRHGVQCRDMSATVKIRHLAVVSPPSQTAASPSDPDAAQVARDGVLVDVVALTADMTLFHSVREAVGERNPVWRARTADEAADLLITGRCGVLLIDMESVSSRGDHADRADRRAVPRRGGLRGRHARGRAIARAADQRRQRLPIRAQAGQRAARRDVPAGGDQASPRAPRRAVCRRRRDRCFAH